MRKFDQRYAVDALTEILPSENAFRKDVDIRLDALETKQDVIDEAAGEARDRVIRYSEEQIAPRAAALQTLLEAATLEADTIRTAAVAEVRGGVSTSGDTLAKLAAVIDTKAPVLDAVLLGRPTCPTPSISADSGDIVNVTALRQSADAVKAEILGAAPAVIDTIAEAAAALGNDANFSATVFAQLAAKQPLAATLTTLAGLSAADCIIPPGTIAYFAMPTPPAGWLFANAALASRSAYSRLFAAVGTTYGAGDGVTTFGLPEGRAEFLRGLDSGRGIDPGRVIGSVQEGQIAAHTHQVDPPITQTSAHTHSHNIKVTGSGGATSAVAGTATADATTYNTSAIASETHQHSVDIAAFTSGSSGGPETRPRNVAFLCCIKY